MNKVEWFETDNSVYVVINDTIVWHDRGINYSYWSWDLLYNVLKHRVSQKWEVNNEHTK